VLGLAASDILALPSSGGSSGGGGSDGGDTGAAPGGGDAGGAGGSAQNLDPADAALALVPSTADGEVAQRGPPAPRLKELEQLCKTGQVCSSSARKASSTCPKYMH